MTRGSFDGVVIKFLVAEQGVGVQDLVSQVRYDFRGWVSPASNRDVTEIHVMLKRGKSSNPTNLETIPFTLFHNFDLVTLTLTFNLLLKNLSTNLDILICRFYCTSMAITTWPK